MTRGQNRLRGVDILSSSNSVQEKHIVARCMWSHFSHSCGTLPPGTGCAKRGATSFSKAYQFRIFSVKVVGNRRFLEGPKNILCKILK